MFPLGEKFSKLVSILRKIWSMAEIWPSEIPKFAHQRLRRVG